jgi:hypothetical protein
LLFQNKGGHFFFYNINYKGSQFELNNLAAEL